MNLREEVGVDRLLVDLTRVRIVFPVELARALPNGMPPWYAGRALEIFDTFVASVAARDDEEVRKAGFRIGFETSQFINLREPRFRSFEKLLEDARVQTYFAIVPSLISEENLAAYIEHAGRFISGYVRGVTEANALHELDGLGRAWGDMAVASTRDGIETIAFETLRGLLDCEALWISRRSIDGMWKTLQNHGLALDASLLPAVSEENVPLVVPLLRGEELEWSQERELEGVVGQYAHVLELAAVFAVPILVGDRCAGAIGMGRRTGGQFDERDRRLTRLMALHIGANILERERAQQLDAVEAEMSALVGAIPQIVYTARSNGHVEWYNRRWFEYTGRNPEEVDPDGWRASIHPHDLDECRRRFEESVAAKRKFEMELRLRAADGSYRWFLAVSVPQLNERGEIVQWIGTSTDIQEQREALMRKEEIAIALRSAFVPKALPVRADVACDALYVAAENDAQVGGDWYDAFDLADGRIGFSIGDIAGHGLQAAVLMSTLRQTIFAFGRDGSDPGDVLTRANAALAKPALATALYGTYDAKTREIAFACAGHPPPILADERGVHILEPDGIPIGFAPDTIYRTRRTHVRGGGLFVLYTDGLIEATRDAVAGERRLLQAVASNVETSAYDNRASDIADYVLGRRTPADDVAVLALSLHQGPAASVSSSQSRTNAISFDVRSGDAVSAQRLRRQLRRFFDRSALTEGESADVEFILGELLANVIEHAPGFVHVDADWSGEQAIVRVTDRGRGFTYRPRLPVDPLSENGRGLYLVSQLAADVVVARLPDGGTEVIVRLKPRRRTYGS